MPIVYLSGAHAQIHFRMSRTMSGVHERDSSSDEEDDAPRRTISVRTPLTFGLSKSPSNRPRACSPLSRSFTAADALAALPEANSDDTDGSMPKPEVFDDDTDGSISELIDNDLSTMLVIPPKPGGHLKRITVPPTLVEFQKRKDAVVTPLNLANPDGVTFHAVVIDTGGTNESVPNIRGQIGFVAVAADGSIGHIESRHVPELTALLQAAP